MAVDFAPLKTGMSNNMHNKKISQASLHTQGHEDEISTYLETNTMV